MTALTAPASAHATDFRLTLPRVIRSEVIKITTLRSTWWSLAIAAVLSVGISLMMAAASRDFGPGYESVMTILAPTQFTMLVAGVLGAIAITGEYSTGMIRSTLTAEPRRGVVLAAKAVVLIVVIAVATALTYAIAIVATAPILGDDGIVWSDASRSLVPLAAGVLSMTAFALIGLSWGFIVRNGSGAIAATVGLLFVLPIVTSMFAMAGEGWRWVVDAGQYLPMMASQTLTTPNAPDMGAALIALLAWVVAGLLGAWAVLRTRDA
ncbi:ABC transporter permease [Microbacterium invictum]|uniref:ABC-2 type transport system permease protein n=1 Tax=Microbacterium invictum TaxID=515415 RepID=A0AA40SMN7_9MICO|nr:MULTISPECIES: ABC transporter permease [Microbacterium]MBB4139011.1 ABC-2 type transport system permease protein [Microbacterium invictum]